MRQVFLDGKGGIVVADVPEPAITEREVLVSVAYSLISSGTERSIVAGSGGGGTALLGHLWELAGKAAAVAAREGPQAMYEKAKAKLTGSGDGALRPLGYSASGVVTGVGGGVLSGIKPGDAVACAGAGFANHAETIAVPANLVVKLPDGVSVREGGFAGVGAIALQGLRRARPEIGDTVLVQGLGLIGMLVAQLAHAAGCRVIGADPSASRVDFAREQFGLEWVVTLGQADLAATVAAATGGMGVDAAVICASTPSSDPINDAFRLTRRKGRVVIVGAVGLNLEREEFYRKELDLLISCSTGPGRYDPSYEEKAIDYPFAYVRWTEGRNMAAFLELVAAKKIDVARLISREYPIAKAAEAYDFLTAAPSEAYGILLTYPTPGDRRETAGVVAESRPFEGSIAPTPAPAPISTPSAISTPAARPARAPQNRPDPRVPIRVAVIGTGNYATQVRLPALRAVSGYHLRAVVSRRGLHAVETARRFKADYSAATYAEVLADPQVDLVFVATRHDLHSAVAVAAASAGKHVFVEKPLALTLEDCASIAEAAARTGVVLAVGFNRRFAPLVAAARALIQGWAGAKVAVYRMNAENLPAEHWLHDPVEGGGRLLGEAVHCFDLLAWLVGEEVARVNALAGSGLDGRVQSSALVSLEFERGSIATVVYSSVGSRLCPKERIEVFGGGNALIIDDFRELAVYGGISTGAGAGPGVVKTAAPVARLRLRQADKGQRHELAALRDLLLGNVDRRREAVFRGATPTKRWLKAAVRSIITSPDPGWLAGVQDGMRATKIALAALDAGRIRHGTWPDATRLRSPDTRQ